MFNLKKKIGAFVILVLLCFFSLNSTAAYAVLDVEGGWLPEKAEGMPDFSASAGFFTKYIWRGWNLGDEPVMQTDASISWYGFTFDFWTNYSLNNDKTIDGGRYQEFTEVDYTFDYTLNVGEMGDTLDINTLEILDPLSLSVGYTYYTFPNVDRDDKYFNTHEIYLGFAYDCILQPAFTWYWDVDSGKGTADGGGNGSYFLFGISHTFDFKESGIAATFGMTTGINDEQWTDKSGFADMVFSCDVSIPIFNYFTITPSVAYSLILDKDTYNDASENEFYGGITIGFGY